MCQGLSRSAALFVAFSGVALAYTVYGGGKDLTLPGFDIPKTFVEACQPCELPNCSIDSYQTSIVMKSSKVTKDEKDDYKLGFEADFDNGNQVKILFNKNEKDLYSGTIKSTYKEDIVIGIEAQDHSFEDSKQKKRTDVVIKSYPMPFFKTVYLISKAGSNCNFNIASYALKENGTVTAYTASE